MKTTSYLLMGIGILIIAAIIVKTSAFGPFSSRQSIPIGKEGTLVGRTRYTADFAASNYEVDLELKQASGKTFEVGYVVFHEQNWAELIQTERFGDWLVVAMPEEGYVRVIALHTGSGIKQDTTLQPVFLYRDWRYREKYNDKPDHLHDNGSSLASISPQAIVVSYEYLAEAAYPPTIPVIQEVSYVLNTDTGLLETTSVADRKLNH